MASWSIVESELIEWLKSYGGPRYHAVLSDPPYALISIAKRFGKAGSAPAQEGSDGRWARLSGGFMGQKWDGFESLEHYQKWVSEWSELMIQRLLYPGAVALFFGGTRTFHHLGVGLENGGFEIVDSILIPWIHGQGFPKSHDISKGLDKAAGAERTKVIGTKPGHEEFAGRETKGHIEFKDGTEGFDRPWMHDDEAREKYHQKLAPVTSDAETWDGYGTALKPAFEPVFLCRAPRHGLTRTWTFAELAVEFGTGALNIDGSRIAGVSQSGAGSPGFGVEREDGYEEGTGREYQTSGRWPANLMLAHHEDCVKVGEYMVDGRSINRWKSDMKPFGGGAGEDYESEEMPPDTIERYACVPGCPVRALDDQVGTLKSGDNAIRTKRAEGVVYGGGKGMEQEPTGEPELTYGDSGGPSRFFYTAKSSKSEKDKGLENFYWKRTDDGFERIDFDEYEKLDKRKRAHGNIHPTCKPLELLRYLATLTLPPKQDGRARRILVPFSGSGSEVIAAVQAGWDEVTGVEMMPIYNEMAEARLLGSIGMF